MSIQFLDRLTLFGIREFNEFSDHAPLQFAFKRTLI